MREAEGGLADCAELMSGMLAVFSWAVHEKYGADKADFQEMYRMMADKLRQKGGRKEMENTLLRIGLDLHDVHI